LAKWFARNAAPGSSTTWAMATEDATPMEISAAAFATE
jgi:hypothetical protein